MFSDGVRRGLHQDQAQAVCVQCSVCTILRWVQEAGECAAVQPQSSVEGAF